MKKKSFSIHNLPGYIWAGILMSMADKHYGWYSSVNALRDNCLNLTGLIQPGVDLSTTRAERKRLEKTKFNFFGLIFKSLDEVMDTVILFEKRHGYDLFYTNKKLKTALTVILIEVRNEK